MIGGDVGGAGGSDGGHGNEESEERASSHLLRVSALQYLKREHPLATYADTDQSLQDIVHTKTFRRTLRSNDCQSRGSYILW